MLSKRMLNPPPYFLLEAPNLPLIDSLVTGFELKWEGDTPQFQFKLIAEGAPAWQGMSQGPGGMWHSHLGTLP